MPTSPAKLAANRANSLKSTGPRTPSGKARSSLNSLSHGLFARTPVLPAENPALYDALKDTLVARFNPADSLEFLLIEKLAICAWKLQRLYRAEAHAHAALASWAPHIARIAKARHAEDNPLLSDEEDDDEQHDADADDADHASTLQADQDALTAPDTPRTPAGFPDWPEIDRRRAEQRRLAKLQDQSLPHTTDPAATLFFSALHPFDPLEKLHKLETQLERSMSRLLRDLRQLQKQSAPPKSDDPEDLLHDLLAHLHNPFLSTPTPLPPNPDDPDQNDQNDQNDENGENDENEPTAPASPSTRVAGVPPASSRSITQNEQNEPTTPPRGTGDPPVSSPIQPNQQNEPTANAPSPPNAASAPSAPPRSNPPPKLQNEPNPSVSSVSSVAPPPPSPPGPCSTHHPLDILPDPQL